MADDPGVREYFKFLSEYYPDADRSSSMNSMGYIMAQVMVHVLKRAGEDLTRENVMRQASSIRDLQLGLLLPTISVNTSPDDFAPLKSIELRRLVGDHWQRLD
jgi:branched-chain amino acid transport system substrate-binding protein